MVNINKKIILASASPRRKEILESAGYKITVYQSKNEDNIVMKKYDPSVVCRCALNKGRDVISQLTKEVDNNAEKLSDYIIVSADTVVVNDGIILGKPKGRDDAMRMLKSLSDKMHIVTTGIGIITFRSSQGNIPQIAELLEVPICEKTMNSMDKVEIKEYNYYDETKVYFRKLTDEDITTYIDRCKPYDKAGSYGIQDENFDFVTKIEGSKNNVIGFPIELFERIFNK